MSAPIRVQIERTRRSTSDLVGTAIGKIAAAWFLTGYLVMLLLPLAFGYHVGYLQAVAIAGLVNVLRDPDTTYLSWTHPAPKRGKR